MNENFDIRVDSEIGNLTGVVIHQPGPEVANMTPETAERALYSDILNLAVASEEYRQLRGVLEKRCRVFQVRDMLQDILNNNRVRNSLIRKICSAENVPEVTNELIELDSQELAQVLIEGVPLIKDNLSRFLSKDRYSLPPLHNFFFTRDSSVVIRDKVLISKMASPVRGRETRVMEAIFDFHPMFNSSTVNPIRLGADSPEVTIEGGDILVAAKDILLIGIGARTTCKAVDFLIERIKTLGIKQHIIIQQLPKTPESFIHLDMVFTLLDKDSCMVYEPVILQTHRYDTVHIHIENGQVQLIKEEDNLLSALKKLGMPLEPVFCGGSSDRWLQEREQWHSGANFFAMGPGQIIGYRRNENTISELGRAGYTIVPADDIIAGQVEMDKLDRFVVTIEGSELARGGGGCRCMTMPLGREPLV